MTSSLYVPVVGHQASSTPRSTNTPPPYRRARSATDRFKFLRRAASSEPPGSPPMSNATQNKSGFSPKLPDAPVLNTLPDPRAPSPITTSNPSPSSGQPHPDLSNEVAAISAKLITAINNQTNLDDALQETRHELEEARAYIARLEEERRQHREALASGILVRKVEIERKEQKLQREMIEEQKRRDSAERQRKGMESELENLTSQLFEEANQMVAAARHEKEQAERRADMYKVKVEETETLLASQQAQLRQLKEVLQQERKQPRDSLQSANTAPSTPVTGEAEKLSSSTFDHPTHTRNALSTQSLPPPESPLHYEHLIHPVVRTDVQSYEDFVSLLRTNRGSSPPSRSTSGSYAGLNVLGIGSKEMGSQSTVIPSLRAVTKPSSRSTSAQTTPTPGANYSPDPNAESANGTSVPLKDTKYYKRALAEDIEPTLRLDTAPGLSWLQRRTVLNSVTTGRLIVEPFPPRHAFHSPAYSCALCGEARTSDEHLRRYRFRASDSDEAQRYPVCGYCLTRLRSTCDFTSFLRMAKKGHMKNETVDECRSAWEECIKLRERMFWSRVGGGVVPTPGSNPVSPVHGRYPETDRESTTQASRSDSDLPSISRADSQRTTSSEQPAVTPLSDVGGSDQLPSKETLPVDKVISRGSSEAVGEKQPEPNTMHQSTEGFRDTRPKFDTSMPPPPLPEPRQTQAGASDNEVIRPGSGYSSRPPSSHASNKAFFEAKEAEARNTQARSSPVTAVDPFKRPSISSSRPSSSRASDISSPVNVDNIQELGPMANFGDSVTVSNTSHAQPLPSQDDHDEPAEASTEKHAEGNPAIDKTPEPITTHTIASVPSHSFMPADLPGKSTTSTADAVVPTRKSNQQYSQSPPAVASSDSRLPEAPEERRTSALPPSATPLHISGTSLSKHDAPSHPAAQPQTQVSMPSPTTFTTAADADPLKLTASSATPPAPETRPRSSASQGIDLHLDAPQPQSKRSSKVAALASRFQQDDDGLQFSRPSSSGSQMRSAAASPERRSVDIRREGMAAGSGTTSPERRGSEMGTPVKIPGAFA